MHVRVSVYSNNGVRVFCARACTYARIPVRLRVCVCVRANFGLMGFQKTPSCAANQARGQPQLCIRSVVLVSAHDCLHTCMLEMSRPGRGEGDRLARDGHGSRRHGPLQGPHEQPTQA